MPRRYSVTLVIVGRVLPHVPSCAAGAGIFPVSAPTRHVATGAGVPQWQTSIGGRCEG